MPTRSKPARAWCRVACLCAALVVAGSALASHAPLPPFVGVPQEAQPSPNQVNYEMYGEAEFYPTSSAHAVVQRGKHWQANMRLAGMSKGARGKDVWARLKPAFLSAGWSVAAEYDQNPFSATLHLQKNGIDAWANIGIFSADDMRMDVVETGPPPALPPFVAPAATPERIDPAHGDFPYLPPLPGSKFQSGRQDAAPMTIKLPGSTQPEIVATGSVVKNYLAAEALSALLFATAYHDALTNAGWTVPVVSQGIHQSDAQLVGHYARNGRDIWAVLHGTPGGYSIAVADAGAKDLGGELATTCHVTLYGLLFDFDKATLKPDSDAVLGRVQAMLQKDAALKVEVQGHTDAVGGDAYNLTLSDARANSVVAWLTQHGIAADRLTAKGYGKAVPVASNDTDEGRARNRRVEVAKLGCKAK